MANLNLSDFAHKVKDDYGPWQVTFPDEVGESTCEFKFLMLASPKARNDFWGLVFEVSSLMNLDQLSEDARETVLSRYEGVDEDPFVYMAGRIQETMRGLAADPEVFDRLRDTMNGLFGEDGLFLGWEGVLSAYVEHYKLAEQAGE